MKTFELIPTGNQKSFYGKAKVNQYECEGEIFSDLISYNTRVAYYNHTTNEVNVLGWHSSTTARHINAFLELYGFDRMTKSEMNK